MYLCTLVGVPNTPQILYTWSMVPDPGNNGRLEYTSDMMQATAHISIGELYCFDPNCTSGALYLKLMSSYYYYYHYYYYYYYFIIIIIIFMKRATVKNIYTCTFRCSNSLRINLK